MLSLLLALCFPAFAAATEYTGYLPGDVFATRNALEEENTTPGYWNHLGVYVGNGLIVEAQIGRGVIYSDLAEFIARYPQIRVMRLRMGDRQAIADEAIRHVGTQYTRLASLPVFLRPINRGNNCVSVVRRAARESIRRDPRWSLPDSAVASPVWEIIYGKG